MPHFFISSNNVEDNKVSICDKENYNHIAKSLRIRKGEKLLLIDENQIQYETIVDEVGASQITALVTNSYKSTRKLGFGLYLAQCPLKSDAQSFVVEKATELGVSGIYPVLSDNCVLNKETVEKKIPKWQRIMYEASKQCERAVIPTYYGLTTFEKLVNEFDRVLVFCERIADKTLKEVRPVTNEESILVIIGPEGGFSDKEFRLFKDLGLEMLTLGSLILKAETAVTVALGNIVYEFSRKN